MKIKSAVQLHKAELLLIIGTAYDWVDANLAVLW